MNSSSYKIQLTKPVKDPLYESLILKWSGAQRVGDKNECIECNAEIKPLKTRSEIDGEIIVWPFKCDPCKKKSYEQHLEEEKKEAYKNRAGKRCCGYQNVVAYHDKKAVDLNSLVKQYDWQEPFIRFIYDICAGTETYGALLTGPPGTGKTLLAKIIHNELIKQYRDTTFIKAVDLTQVIRKETLKAEEYRDVTREFKNVPMLIVDDYGTQKNTDFVRETMYSIFDYRYEQRMQTILTTNMSPDEMSKVEPRLYSRIYDKSWMKQFLFLGFDMRIS